MRTEKTPTWLIIVLIIALAVVAMLMGAASCDENQPDVPSEHPLPCATYQGLDGRWYDEDSEVVDEDPCDGVDKPKPSKSSPVKPSPPKKSTAPAPRVTRR